MRIDRRRLIARALSATGIGLGSVAFQACSARQLTGRPSVPRRATTILTDKDVIRHAEIKRAIGAVEQALAARAADLLIAPPRHAVQFGDNGSLVFTIGGTTGQSPLSGFRVYETFQAQRENRSQLVVVWDTTTAALRGVIIGEVLGQIRTGAIGGVAVRLMSRDDARIVGVIGSGAQARTQLEATAAVRSLSQVRVFSRSADNRGRFASEMTKRLGVPVSPVGTAHAAVEDADIVLLATSSGSPVIEAAWLEPGTHINAVGPKVIDNQELDLRVAEAARVITTDSPEQARSYEPPFFLTGTPHMARMVDLASIWKQGGLTPRPADAITLFCSVGLAGTEVLVADDIIARASGTR